ncbi:MAG: SMI1/KNR4 family protein [Bacteroidota bacterium]
MESWISEALAQWNSSGTKMNPPASIEEIERVEATLNFKFPEDFKQLYLVVNGFPDYHWQEYMFCFWPLEMIVEEFERFPKQRFIPVCDFLLASHEIGFVRNESGIYKYDYSQGNKIAETYQQVVAMINSNADDIY